jgi:hypothetical protein
MKCLFLGHRLESCWFNWLKIAGNRFSSVFLSFEIVFPSNMQKTSWGVIYRRTNKKPGISKPTKLLHDYQVNRCLLHFVQIFIFVFLKWSKIKNSDENFILLISWPKFKVINVIFLKNFSWKLLILYWYWVWIFGINIDF